MKLAPRAVLGDLKISEYLIVLDDPVRNEVDRPQVLVFSTRSGVLLAVPVATWKSLVEARADPISSDLMALLQAAEVLVPTDQAEYEHLMHESRLHSEGSTTLLRVILPTFQCNLGCVYCGQNHVAREISEDLSARLVTDIEVHLRTGVYERVQITWFGGEPSTAPDAIQRLSAAFLDVCARFRVGYSARMITNGVALSKSRAAEFYLRDQILAFDISLDGPREVHNWRRPLRGAGSSYDRIVTNLKAIGAEPKLDGCELSIRVNVDRENAPYISTLIDDLATQGFAPRVGLYFALVVDWNPERKKELLSRQEFADLEVAWLVRAMERGFRPPLLPKRRYSACLAGETSSSVVAADGTVHNCTMTPLAGHAITATTRPLGHLGEDVSAENLERHNQIFARLDTADLECNSCRFLFLCQGGCPKELDTGELPCPSFKFNMGSRMLLQYAGMSDRNRGCMLVDITQAPLKDGVLSGTCLQDRLLACIDTEDRSFYENIVFPVIDRTSGFEASARLLAERAESLDICRTRIQTTLDETLRRFQDQVPSFYPPRSVRLAFSLGAFAGKLALGDRSEPRLYLALEHALSYPDSVGIVLAHELAHFYHFCLNPEFFRRLRIQREVWRGLICEGFATWMAYSLTRVPVPNLDAPSIDEVRQKENLQKEIARLIADLDEASGAAYDLHFRLAEPIRDVEFRIGHHTGFLVCQHLATRGPLKELLAGDESLLRSQVASALHSLGADLDGGQKRRERLVPSDATTVALLCSTSSE